MFVDPSWLATKLDEVKIVDASWHMPDTGRDADAEFEAAHIPGAQRFSIDAISDPSSALPHTLPSPEAFAAHVGALGIGTRDTVVVYEAGAPFAAPRAWWMLRTMGADVVKLSGGLARWQAEGHPVESGPARTVTPATFEPTFDAEGWTDADGVARALGDGSATVVDARGAPRFEGQVDEPRAGLRAGHMPGARNVPYASLVDADGQFKDAEALRAAFTGAGVDLSKPVITSCGSGVTACILTMALESLGTPSAVYDGSWTEWGGDPARDVVKGPAD